MEMTHREGEGLLRHEQRGVLVPHNSRLGGWDGEPEKAPFLRNEPVKLTPAWEGSNLPNDTLNLKGIAMENKKNEGTRTERVAMELAPPKDKWNIIFFTLMLHGLGTLCAWNMFITEKSYFVDYKLANATEYSENFMSYIGFASQIPNFLFSWFNIFVPLGGNLTKRIVVSLVLEVVVLAITVVLAMLDSTNWPAVFFWITMISVFVLNSLNAIFQNCVFGVAARLPPAYTGAVVLGSNLSGLLVTLLAWLTDVVASGNHRTAAIYYFIGGMFVLLVCFDTYFALPLNRFYRYHENLQARTEAATPIKVNFWSVVVRCWPQLYNVFIIFFVTLAIFPSVHSDIKPSTPGFLGNNFMRITCFLTFNLTAMLGNVTASLCQFPRPRYLWLFTTLRILFIPFFLVCNYQPVGLTRTLPVLVHSDVVYWVAAILMGWSSGHGSSLAMMYVSGTVDPVYAGKAGMIGGATLITGIVSGIVFTRISPIIVTMDLWKNI